MLDRSPDSRFPTLTERFVTYAKINTQADETSDTYPSSKCQLDLAKVLVDELQALGLSDAAMDEYGYVTASLAANDPAMKDVPVIAFISHMDTYPEVSGKDVKPVFHENYQAATSPCPTTTSSFRCRRTPT